MSAYYRPFSVLLCAFALFAITFGKDDVKAMKEAFHGEATCVCQCCDALDKSLCLNKPNSTFLVNSCGDCTLTKCKSVYPDCKKTNTGEGRSMVVHNKCIDDAPLFNKIVLSLFFGIVFGLLLLSLIRDQLPWLVNKLHVDRGAQPPSSRVYTGVSRRSNSSAADPSQLTA